MIFEQARELLEACLLHAPLRDELYIQLLKQLRRNPDRISLNLGYDLLYMCLKTFPPTERIENHLEYFLRTVIVTTHLTLTNAVLVHALHERVYLGPVSNETMIYTTTDIQERRVKTMNMLVVKEVPANNASNKKMPPKPRTSLTTPVANRVQTDTIQQNMFNQASSPASLPASSPVSVPVSVPPISELPPPSEASILLRKERKERNSLNPRKKFSRMDAKSGPAAQATTPLTKPVIVAASPINVAGFTERRLSIGPPPSGPPPSMTIEDEEEIKQFLQISSLDSIGPPPPGPPGPPSMTLEEEEEENESIFGPDIDTDGSVLGPPPSFAPPGNF